jgi:membrane-bound metal-dependent hydrolase YbcI (DUF457 family)
LPYLPYHFGPSGLVGLAFRRWLDVPVFVLANVVVDIEPGFVVIFRPHYPVHGYAHTFLFGGLIGLLWGLLAFRLKDNFKAAMQNMHIPYEPDLRTMLLSGLLGVWFHVILDSLVWNDIRPLWPLRINPFLGLVKLHTLECACVLCFLAAIVIYMRIRFVRQRVAVLNDRSTFERSERNHQS